MELIQYLFTLTICRMFELSRKQKFGGSVRLYFGVDYLESNIHQVEVGDEMELT